MRSDPGDRGRRSDPPPVNPPANTGGNDRPNRGGDNGGRRDPFDRGRNDGGNRSGDRPRNDNPIRMGGPVNGAWRSTGERPNRERPSRSGKVSYGTRSNGFGTARPARFGGGMGRTSLANQIRRTDIRTGYNVSYGGVFGGLRIGYVGYNNYWNDDFFCYPYYVFNPWAANGYCVASPWYRYSYLPGYINTSRVVIVNNYVSPWSYNDWQDYRYDYQDRNRDRRNEALDDTLDDIQDAFERNNTRYADRVVPATGQVAIFNDGKYDYSLGAEDFQDMFLDGVEQSKTVRYEIIESKVRGDEVRLRARHEYEDSWGAKQVVFHAYTLRRENGRFVIREFGTD